MKFLKINCSCKSYSLIWLLFTLAINSSGAEARLGSLQGKLINSANQKPINGLTVALINLDLGRQQFKTISGEVSPGQFAFKSVPAGNYRIDLSPLGRMRYPSITSLLQPQSTTAASSGSRFTIAAGQQMDVVIPLDPLPIDLRIQKTVDNSNVQPGGIVQFRLTIDVLASSEREGPLAITDALPPGFSFISGSTEVDGETVIDLLVSANKNVLVFKLDQIPLGERIRIAYQAKAGAIEGTAYSLAMDFDVRQVDTKGVDVSVHSNTSQTVELRGRVINSPCQQIDLAARNGVANIKVYFDNGEFVLTDTLGYWRYDGNSKVSTVRFDKTSLPKHLQFNDCDDIAVTSADFFGYKAGLFQRKAVANVYTQMKSLTAAEVVVQHSVSRADDGVNVSLQIVPNPNTRLDYMTPIYNLPPGWAIVSGSEEVNGVASTPAQTVYGWVWTTGADQQQDISFTIAPLSAQLPKWLLTTVNESIEKLILRPRFGTRSAALSDADKIVLQVLVNSLRLPTGSKVKVLGHSDNVPIAVRNRQQFANNYVLSQARAQTVLTFLQQLADNSGIDWVAQGIGPDQPLLSNTSAKGREFNRRVELLIQRPVDESTPAPFILRPRFSKNSDILSAQGRESLSAFLLKLQGLRYTGLRVIAHTSSGDDAGKFVSKVQLSEARADKVAWFLLQQLPINASEIQTKGAGAQFPVASNKTSSGRMANRRIEIQLINSTSPVATSSEAALPAKGLSAQVEVRFASAHTEQGVTGAARLDLRELANSKTVSATTQ